MKLAIITLQKKEVAEIERFRACFALGALFINVPRESRARAIIANHYKLTLILAEQAKVNHPEWAKELKKLAIELAAPTGN